MLFLKEHTAADDYKACAIDIAAAIDAVHAALMKKAIAAHPQLEKEIEDQMTSYGGYL